MIDKWFIEDIDNQLAKRKRVVVLDPTRSYAFLIKLLQDKGYTVLHTDEKAAKEWQRVKDEMLLRYQAETDYADQNVVFYATRPKEQLSFIFDYCFTHGCVDFSQPVQWLKERLFAATGLQIMLESNLLLTAAKLSVGKTLEWWKKILQNLEDLISLEDELLPFLSNPVGYFANKDDDIKRLFEEKLFELLGQPYTQKPPQTLAKEVAHLIFTQLLNNDIKPELLAIYRKWVDSQTYSQSLKKYAEEYKIPADVNIWNVHPDHCFKQIDLCQLKEIAQNFRNRPFVGEKIQKLQERVKSRYARQFLPGWQNDLITLVSFDTKPLAGCSNIHKVVEFYTSSFYKVDRAIRNLYAEFINEEEIIRPIQEYYESLNSELLSHWFEYINEYKPNQAGYLADLFKQAQPKTAVIVGDGIRYEMAEYVSAQLSGSFQVSKEVMLAGVPSETEHNMSALYMQAGEIDKLQKNREKRLLELTGKEIVFKNLEALNYGETADYLVLTYKDIDSAGEKLQLGALKLFGEFEKVLVEKIELLIKKGYKVHLVTDHGFVLTGLLDEADKIEADVSGKAEIHERYIRTVEKQNKPNWVEFTEKYGDRNYVYVTKNHRPFKSVGVYGFAHGGLTPQEVIIPNFVFEKKQASVEGLKVVIQNKSELAEVVGENFGLKVKAAESTGDLFAASRKIQVILFTENKQFSQSNIAAIEAGKTISYEFSFDRNSVVKAVVIDAESKEQLDVVEIKKSSARDLDGLL
ncbi:PglZ domain-containing protein [Tenuifilum thalassicum]|uniref:PglZ domain-containing protein n=1 Tax=Tenuifilum thalassicum TaxID=2590900 RepID=A0A7D4C206_9BACT|nr:PglZ domain-containing protein [Tenuifilum thalassicum]QKG81084.1 PglZ domain-containing protein [Tenuifilum thalassicum]